MDETAIILIVEDDAIVAISICSMLEDLGYTIAGIVASAEEAVQIARCRRPDLVLMDVNLAGLMDGIEGAKLMAAELGVRIVYVTAQMDRETRDRALAMHPEGFLTKPFSPDDLADAVAQALTRRSR